MDIVREYFKGDKLAIAMGMVIENVSPGQAVISMPLEEQHKNGLGGAHGGALFSLADFCLAVASNSHGRAAVAISCTIAYHRAVRSGVLTATARELHCGSTIASYMVEITDETQKRIATFQGQVFRTQNTLEAVLAERDARD
ncbi:MAG: hotdog fold thioesterase [Candidatus Hydrogenedens sp.]|jgi:acyl-CoA thioesterase|nr:hotdog fold thioesterase [Candidatus Hydrogenedens sp.]